MRTCGEKSVNKFNNALDNIVTTLNKKEKYIIKYDMFAAITNAVAKFKELDINNNITDASVTTNFSEMANNGIIIAKFNQGVNNENINKYFFFDDFHPNKWAHNVIAQELIALINNMN